MVARPDRRRRRGAAWRPRHGDVARWYTTSPPIMVASGTMSLIRSSGHVKTSSEQTMRSARRPGVSAPRSVLLVRRVGVPRGEGAHGLLARHALPGLPAAVLARERPARHGRVDAVEGVRALHREVGAAGDDHAGVEQRPPRVGALESLRPETLLAPTACPTCSASPACSAARRARGSEECRRRPGSARAPPGGAARAPRAAPRASLERVEREGVGPVADRVHADLKAALQRLARQSRQLIGRDQAAGRGSRGRRSTASAAPRRASRARRRTGA